MPRTQQLRKQKQDEIAPHNLPIEPTSFQSLLVAQVVIVIIIVIHSSRRT
jgi:hypothetical protein